jgi:5-methylcytosine-specific restriction endonuclease McrA
MLTSSILQRRVLVLNKNWQAINTSTAGHAISLVFAGQAKGILIENGHISSLEWSEWKNIELLDTDVTINTVTSRIKIPNIIVLCFYDKIPKQAVKLTQNNLWERDKFTCQYTGVKVNKSTGNIDHIVPRSLGGKTTWENCVIACKEINDKKSDRTLEQAGLVLIKNPTKPKTMPVSFFIKNNERNSDWNWFLH